jgi:hypothetical protein
VSGRRDGLTDENRYIWAEENPSVVGRQQYAEALQGSADDEWMRRQMMRSVIGTEKFMRQLKLEGGRHRRKRGRPAKRVNKDVIFL